MNLLKSSAFRHAVIYAALFSVSVIILMAFIYWSTAAYMARQIDTTIQTEIGGLAEHYERRGLRGLRELITQRIQRQNPTGSSIYLLIDSRQRRIAGNLNRWPRKTEVQDEWLNFELTDERTGSADVYKARARAFLLTGGYRLMVGRDIRSLSRIQQRIIWALGWGLGITLLLGLLGGILFGRSASKRIDAINQTSREIMAGELSRRIPTYNTNDEYDQLADNLNRMLDRIEQLMEGVRRVSDNIAHDLKTPLARLRNQLETVRDKGDSETQESLQAAVDEADSLLNTFNALLRIARLETAEQRAEFCELDFSTLVDDVIELYEPVAEDKSIMIDASITPDLNVYGDRDLLFQAIANLLDNAIKYSENGDKVAVNLKADGSSTVSNKTIVLKIADHGPGIPPQFQEKVFQRFFRLDQSRSTQGNGLGLSLVKAVITLHDGQISLTDNHPGLSVHIRLKSQ